MIVHFIDGTEADSNDIIFNSTSYHFLLATNEGNVDITNDLDVLTKRSLVPDFDENRDLLRISNEEGVGQTQGKVFDPATPTTTTEVLGQQSPSDWVNNGINGILDAGKAIVGAANDALQGAAKSAGATAGQSVVPVVGLLLVAGFVAYFLWKK